MWQELRKRKRRKIRHSVHKKGADQPKQSSSIDFRTVGVRQTTSGSWSVEILFKKKLRYIGTFKTQDLAALANQVSREHFDRWRDEELSSTDLSEKVKLARDNALDAVSRIDANGLIGKRVAPAKSKESERKLELKRKYPVNAKENAVSKEAGKPTGPGRIGAKPEEKKKNAPKVERADKAGGQSDNSRVTKKKAAVDYRTCGVRKVPSGKWVRSLLVFCGLPFSCSTPNSRPT